MTVHDYIYTYKSALHYWVEKNISQTVYMYMTGRRHTSLMPICEEENKPHKLVQWEVKDNYPCCNTLRDITTPDARFGEMPSSGGGDIYARPCLNTTHYSLVSKSWCGTPVVLAMSLLCAVPCGMVYGVSEYPGSGTHKQRHHALTWSNHMVCVMWMRSKPP